MGEGGRAGHDRRVRTQTDTREKNIVSFGVLVY